MRREWLFVVVPLVGAAVASASCSPTRAPAIAPALRVEVAGCASVRAASRCEAPRDASVSLWVRAPADARVSLATDLGPIDPPRSPAQEGTLYRVALGAARALRVVAAREGATSTWTMAIEPPESVAWMDAARDLRARGRFDDARARAAEGIASSPPSSVARARGLGLLGRIDRSRGDLDLACAELREALALDRELGLLSDEANDSFALAYVFARQSHRYGDARAVLDDAAAALAQYPEGAAKEPYYRGLIAMEIGDARQALRDFRRAAGEAQRLGLDLDAQRARGSYALELELVGRWRDALDELRALERDAAAAPPCDRVSYAINVGYGALLANEATGAQAYDAVGPLERARQLQTECPDAHERVTILANLALAELGRGAIAAARARLAEATAIAREPTGSLAWSLLEIEAEAALRAGEPARALDAFDREAALAGGAAPERAWHAAYGRGEALRAMGRSREALASYARAEAVLDDALAMVPLGEGRSTFLAEREKSARALVASQLALGQVEAAAATARHAHARVVASVTRATQIGSLDAEARARWDGAVGAYRRYRDALDDAGVGDWKRSKRALEEARRARASREAALRASLEEALAAVATARHAPSPPPGRARASLPDGTVDLTFFRGADGFVAFVSTRAATRAVKLGDVAADAPPGDLAARLLAPLRSQLADARTIRVHADPLLWSRDLHALPFDGAPLASRAAVEYAIGIDSAPRAPGDGAALVVGDATGDLPNARTEAQEVAAALASQASPAPRLLVGAVATRAAVREALPSVELFHYAGHGLFAGREGWDSVLPLADGAHLSIADILSLPSVPRIVVLSACEGARASAGDEIPGVGIAQAFLAAGAEVAVAAVRPVEDDVARAIVRGFYAQLREGRDFADALRRSELALRAAKPSADWSAFRVLRP